MRKAGIYSYRVELHKEIVAKLDELSKEEESERSRMNDYKNKYDYVRIGSLPLAVHQVDLQFKESISEDRHVYKFEAKPIITSKF